jgi:hypothetical protein
MYSFLLIDWIEAGQNPRRWWGLRQQGSVAAASSTPIGQGAEGWEGGRRRGSLL